MKKEKKAKKKGRGWSPGWAHGWRMAQGNQMAAVPVVRPPAPVVVQPAQGVSGGTILVAFLGLGAVALGIMELTGVTHILSAAPPPAPAPGAKPAQPAPTAAAPAAAPAPQPTK
jgi:hypothetical protein